MKEYAKFRVETNRDFLIFWAVLFFTCVVGIIELLDKIEKRSFSNPSLSISILFDAQFYITMIYFGLVFGIILSIYSAFSIYRENAEFTRSGELGEDYKKHAKKHPTLTDKFILTRYDKPIEALFMIALVVVFALLYCIKIGLLR